MRKNIRNRNDGKKGNRWFLMALISVCLLLSFTSCGDTEQKTPEEQKEEEEHQRAIQEMGEYNRQRAAKRQRALESTLFTSAKEYVADILKEAAPKCTFTLTLEAGGYYEASEEELAAVVDTEEAARAFFDDEYRLLIEGNWRKVYGDDPEPLLKELTAHGISGGLDWQMGGPCYTFNADTGEILFHPAQGY